MLIFVTLQRIILQVAKLKTSVVIRYRYTLIVILLLKSYQKSKKKNELYFERSDNFDVDRSTGPTLKLYGRYITAS